MSELNSKTEIIPDNNVTVTFTIKRDYIIKLGQNIIKTLKLESFEDAMLESKLLNRSYLEIFSFLMAIKDTNQIDLKEDLKCPNNVIAFLDKFLK
jgi:hypothetical protein